MRRTGFSFLALALFGFVLWTPTEAHGADKPALLVLQVDSDNVSDADKEAILKKTKAQIAKYRKYQLPKTPAIDLLDEMVNFECLEMDAECLAKIGAKHKADQVLYTRWQNRKLSLLLVDVKNVKTLKSYDGTVSTVKMGNHIENTAVAKLLGPLPKKKKAVWVTIESNVKDAEVFVDEKKVGTTPVKKKMLPGDYTVAVRKAEFLMVEQSLKVTGTKPVKWTAKLKPIPKKKKVVVTPPVNPPKKGDEKKKRDDTDDDEDKPFYATWWFWTIVGVGVAAAATGTALALSGGDSTETGAIRFSVDSGDAENDAVFYNGLGSGGN